MIIENEEENEFVLNNAKSLKSGVWLGGRKTQDGKWVWLDGTEFEFKKWAYKQPDNYLEIEDKLAMKVERDPKAKWNKGEWNDAPNNVTNPFVCQHLISKKGKQIS